MLSRTQLRIEAMHHLFAFYARAQAMGASYPLVADEVLRCSLEEALTRLHHLHTACLQLLLAWQAIDSTRHATQLVKPAYHLGNIGLLRALAADATFAKLQVTYPLPWSAQRVKHLYYEAVAEAPLVVAYKQAGAITPAEELALLEGLVSKVIFKHKELQALLVAEDNCWHHHRPIVRRQVLTFLARWATAPQEALAYYQDRATQEKTYYQALVEGVLAKSQEHDIALQAQAPQWDVERMLLLDKVLIKMAVVELAHTETEVRGAIIHAYLEIAKTYSGAQSHVFINAMVDTLAKG